MMNTLADIQFEEEVMVDDIAVTTSTLIIHNDEHNTFDWVIQALIDVCKHSFEQAEQCSYIIHYKGKYAVKHGSLGKLKPMKDAITERGINATIES
jgi:ATP-dependent Clp protease adaptor protein ClpS